MKRIYLFFIMLIPVAVFSQGTIRGRILNQADTRPVAGANVFLNNSSVGTATAGDGAFKLTNIKPGKYKLTVSIVGFEKYDEDVMVSNTAIILPDILIIPQTIQLAEVKIKSISTSERQTYFNWFKDEFLGSSVYARECQIDNPEVLSFDYDRKNDVLTASSSDFLVIENKALGYKIKYLVSGFTLDNRPSAKIHLNYIGSVLFEPMTGTPAQEKRWERRRQDAYEGSFMHFLRSALNGRMDKEGFQALLIKRLPTGRPPDSVINAKIRFYKEAKPRNATTRDSLAFWLKLVKQPAIIEKLLADPLQKKDLIKPTAQPGVFAFGLSDNNDALFVTYNKRHHFSDNWQTYDLNSPGNKGATRVDFNVRYEFVDNNGGLFNPDDVAFNGAWARARVADMLPVDYEPPGADAEQLPPFKADSTLADYLQNHITEKAYLQFDKPSYAAGDTIYFKAYVTAGEQHKLSAISGVLHVDLINAQNKIGQSVKLQLDSGLAWGDFALPDSLRAGLYRVRAYTQWMRNSGDDALFEKELQIVSAKASKITGSLVKAQLISPKADIQFMPEGGELVAGLPSVVAFKALGPNGLGVNINGEIIDNNGARVTSFISSRLGMGSFGFTPAAGKSYSARISYADGRQDIIGLPKPQPEGISLSINNDALPKATVTIRSTEAYFKQNKGDDYRLLISSGELIATVDCELDSVTLHIDIPKRQLRTGIATITLFSPNNEPLAERLFFVQNYDELSLNLKSNMDNYTEREKTHISLKALNRRGVGTTGHFSVSVVNENVVPGAQHNDDNILSYLLLTSDLKGNVEQPAYYFEDTSITARRNLDLLMLTQGYRRFEWKQVLDTVKARPAYQPESGITIAGHVTNMTNKPVGNGTVTLISLKGGVPLITKTDENGRFSFGGLNLTDSVRFVLNATNQKGDNRTKITLEKETAPSINHLTIKNITQRDSLALASYAGNEKDELIQVANYVNQKTIMLKQVNVRDKKRDDQYRTQSLAGAGNADQVLHSKDLLGGPLSTSLYLLHGVKLAGNGPAEAVPYLDGALLGVPMLVIVDGVELPNTPQNPPNVNLINPSDVETIELLKYANTAIYGMQGAGGVLIITTKRGGGLNPKDIPSVGVLPINIMGFYQARVFYSPKYDAQVAGKQRDLRSTIYWQPELKTDKDGKAEFEYYNADLPGTYKVTIEGIDNDGNIGRQVYRYQVK